MLFFLLAFFILITLVVITRYDILIYAHAASLPFFLKIPGLNGYYVTPLFILSVVILLRNLNISATKESQSVIKSRISLAVILFFFSLLVSFVANPSIYAFISAIPRIVIVASGFIIGDYLGKMRKLDNYLEVYTSATAILSLMTITEITSNLGMNKNHLGLMLAISSIVSLTKFNKIHHRFLFAPLSVVALMYTGSRSAILGFACVACIHLFLKSTKSLPKKITFFGLFPIVISVLFAKIDFPYKERLLDFTPDLNTSGGYSVFARIQLYKQAWEEFKRHKIFGNGIGGVTLDSFYQTSDAHNFLLQALGEGGLLLGTSTLILVIGTCIYLIQTRALNSSSGVLAFYLWISIVTHGILDVMWVMGRANLFWVVFGVVVRERFSKKSRINGSEVS